MAWSFECVAPPCDQAHDDYGGNVRDCVDGGAFQEPLGCERCAAHDTKTLSRKRTFWSAGTWPCDDTNTVHGYYGVASCAACDRPARHVICGTDYHTMQEKAAASRHVDWRFANFIVPARCNQVRSALGQRWRGSGLWSRRVLS